MKRIFAVYGMSGFGREVMPLVKQGGADEDSFCFIDDAKTLEVVNSYPVYDYNDFLELNFAQKFVVIAIADPSTRSRLTHRVEADELEIVDVFANNSVCLDRVDLGQGGIVCPFVTLTSNIKIGKSFHANIYSYVAHDCVIGDYVTFAPNVQCNGNVHIQDHAYIGAGAIIKQGTATKPLVIGAGAVVGMGAVVTKDVPPGVVVVGNPAKPLIKK